MEMMAETTHSRDDLRQLYRERFKGAAEYRKRMWGILSGFFQQWIPIDGNVLDLGCGYCEFINAIACARKYGMDLNPDAVIFAAAGTTILEQDCSQPWRVEPNSLDAVFTSNFFEHLPAKAALESTLVQALRALKPGGRLIAMGPNIRFLAGAYWDFFDHYLPLTEKSLVEVLTKVGFEIEVSRARFMPYTTAGKTYPMLAIRAYLAFPFMWRLFGKQFLIVARKAAS
jgi:SAM-dependent methyltransferase